MFKAVEVDETSCYRIDEADRPLIESIRQVYLFDDAEVTNLCELEPSYRLEPLYVNVYLRDGVDDLMAEDLHEKYGQEPSEGTYLHVWRVNGMSPIELHPPEGFELDEVLEYFRGNHVL